MEPPIDLLVYSSEDVSVAPILLTVAEMGLMKGEGEDLVERLSGVSPPVPAETEAAEAEPAAAAAEATELAVCSAELKVDVETAVPLLASPALPPPVTPAVPPPPSLPLPTLRLLLAFGVDDLGMKDEANGDPPPLFAVAAGILVISTRSIDGE